MSEATDVSPCPACGVQASACQLADEAGHHWNGRHKTYDPRAMWCCSCGHEWLELDLDAVARNWRAQAAHYREETPERPPGRPAFDLTDLRAGDMLTSAPSGDVYIVMAALAKQATVARVVTITSADTGKWWRAVRRQR